ncbi:MAG: hypothetical protein GY725_13925 [bacterium]|nr:hypothetical protein [bacterium]
MSFKKPVPRQGSRGTPASRRMQRNMAGHILGLSKDLSVSGSAELTGLTNNDIKNLRAGNMPSFSMLQRFVKKMRWTPESIFATGKLKKLPAGTRTHGADTQKIRRRIQAVCRDNDAQRLASATRIPISNIYQTRTRNAKIGLHTFLSIASAGFSPRSLLLGTPKLDTRLAGQPARHK